MLGSAEEQSEAAGLGAPPEETQDTIQELNPEYGDETVRGPGLYTHTDDKAARGTTLAPLCLNRDQSRLMSLTLVSTL